MPSSNGIPFFNGDLHCEGGIVESQAVEVKEEKGKASVNSRSLSLIGLITCSPHRGTSTYAAITRNSTPLIALPCPSASSYSLVGLAFCISP